MKKTKLTRSLLAACSIVALTAVLSGCLHDGGSDTATDDMMTTDPPTPVAVTLPNLPTGAMYALSADTHTIAAGESAENGGVSFMCAAGGEACMVTVAADGTATATGGTVTASLTAAAKTAYDMQKAAMMAMDSGRAMGLHSALSDEDGDYGQEIVGAATSKVSLSISRGTSGSAKVTDGTTGWTSASAGTAISGWHGTLLTRKMESITVYTDIEPAKRVGFLTVYVPGATDAPLGSGTLGAAVGTEGQLTLTAAEMGTAAGLGLLDPNEFPSANDDDEDNLFTYSGATGQHLSSFPGTYHGASGTYHCGSVASPATNCTARVTDATTAVAASYSFGGSGWEFVPDTNNNPQAVSGDADFLRFGWWTDTPEEAAVGGEYLYDAEMFYGGSTAYVRATGDDTLSGAYDYEGPAAGLFAIQADEDGSGAAHGEFSAMASLTADFGDNTSGEEGGSLSGTISDFVRSDGVTNDWELSLQSTDIDVDGTTSAWTVGAGTTNAMIVDGSSAIGVWEAAFFGPADDADGNDLNPSGIAGAFHAGIDDRTAVAGAFGAERQ